MLSPTIYNYFDGIFPEITGNHLEIGIFDGEGISNLAEKYPNKFFYAVDPFLEDGNTSHISNVHQGEPLTDIQERAEKNISKCPNIKLYIKTSVEFFKGLTKEDITKLNISTVSIDGSHHYEDVVEDIMGAIKVLNGKPGHIHFDDAFTIEGVRRAISEMESSYPHLQKKITGADHVVFIGIW
jgi:hypothetical protein